MKTLFEFVFKMFIPVACKIVENVANEICFSYD